MTLDELDEVLASAVAVSRRADVPDDVLQGALERIAARPVPDISATPVRQVRRRLVLLASSAAAVLVVLAFLLGGPPAAGAEVMAVMRLQAPPAANVAPAANGGFRGLLIVHVIAIVGAYLAIVLSWVAATLPSVLLLFNARPPRFCRAALTISVVLLPIGAALEALGFVLGGVWTQLTRGQFWNGDVREVEALLLIALAAGCFVLAWRWRSHGLLVAAVVAAGLWVVVLMRWMVVLHETSRNAHGYGPNPWPRLLACTVCAALLNALLLAAGHVLARRAR